MIEYECHWWGAGGEMLAGCVGVTVLLEGFRSCFTAPSFRALVVGMLAAGGRRTVCGRLVGAGLSALWPHDRAHRFPRGRSGHPTRSASHSPASSSTASSRPGR